MRDGQLCCEVCSIFPHLMIHQTKRRLPVQTDWDNMIYPSTVMLAMLTDNQAFHTAAQAYLQKWLCRCLIPLSSAPCFVWKACWPL